MEEEKGSRGTVGAGGGGETCGWNLALAREIRNQRVGWWSQLREADLCSMIPSLREGDSAGVD